MQSFQKPLALVLLTLLLSFSFNAYACLVPIYGGMQVSPGTDCSKPGEEPAWQFCDGFKTLAVQSGPDLSSDTVQVAEGWNRSTPSVILDQPVAFLSPSKKGELLFPKDLLALHSVFRN